MTKYKSDWNHILYFKDIILYLSFADNILLSTCSKKLRHKLYFDNFQPFHFKEYINKGVYRTFECEVEGKQDLCRNPYHMPTGVILENVAKFEYKLKKLDQSFKTLIICDIYDYLYGYKIAERLTKITILDLKLFITTQELLQYMLNKLPLTQLSIKSTTILTKDCTVDIMMPQSLSKLKLEDVKCKNIKEDSNLLDFKNKQTIEDLENFNLTPQHIPSLETLYYSSGSYIELANFINLNPQLKSIRTNQDHINDNIYILLSSKNQLKQLFVESFEFTRNYIFKLPTIFSLITFSITLDYDFDYSMELIKAFPNITRFTVKYNYIVDNLNILWFASKFRKLKFLRLEFIQGLELDSDFEFPEFCELAVLEFIGIDERQFNWDELSEENKLKFVKFYKFAISKEVSFVPKIEAIGKWIIMNYNDSNVYYKR